MHQVADDLQCTWVTGRDMPTSTEYIIDHDGRVIYLNGRLDLTAYFTSLRRALNELSGADIEGLADVLPIRRRAALPRDRGTG